MRQVPSFLAGLVILSLPFAFADVFENARVAQRNLRTLLMAESIYANDNEEWFPLDPAWLYPELVADPATFWHPGDATNPRPPQTIDNSASNNQNSARISFDFVLPNTRWAWDAIAIRDNSESNNDDEFVNFITLDGVIETEPPNAAPTPTTFAMTRGHMQRLAVALRIYANDNSDYFPQDLYGLWSGSGMLSSPRSYWNPGDADPLPRAITNAIPNGAESAAVSFELLTAGIRTSDIPAGAIVLRDNTPENNAGFGVFAFVWSDNPTVHFITVCPGDLNQDQVIDLADFAQLQVSYGRWDDRYTPADGDFDADGGVFEPDRDAMLENFGIQCE